MKKTISLLLFSSTLMSITQANATSIKDNEVIFSADMNSDYQLKSTTFTLKDYAIKNKGKKNEQWQGIHHSKKAPNTLDIKAKREGDANVVHVSKGWIRFKESSNYGKVPDKLNFAVFGTLTLETKDGHKFVFNDMYLAQGHNFFGNNWWIAGKYCTYLNRSNLSCNSVNGAKLNFTIVDNYQVLVSNHLIRTIPIN